MKRLCLLLALSSLLLCSCTTVTPPSPPTPFASSTAIAPGRLQVQVNVPATWQPFLEDQIADAFVSQVSEVFHRDGYRGDVVEVRSGDRPDPAQALLAINLVEWRMNHTGSVVCTFTANVAANGRTRQLGLFNGMALRWMNGPGRFGLSDTYDAAAADALRSLYRDVAKTGLVPGAVAFR